MTTGTHDYGRLRRIIFALAFCSGLLGLLVCSGGLWAAGPYIVTNLGNASDLLPGNGLCSTSAGVCTLRAAIEEANASPGADVIDFDPSLVFPNTIVLTTALTIVDGLTINGPTTGVLTLDARNLARHFQISSPSSPVNISNLDLINGQSADNGGSIFFQPASGGTGCCRSFTSTLNLKTVHIRNSSAKTNGGAVYMYGLFDTTNFIRVSLNLTDVTFSQNKADISGGGVFIAGEPATVNIFNSTLAGNSAIQNGGAIFNSGGTVFIANSTLSNNGVNGRGGAIFNSADAAFTSTVNIHSTTITGNRARNGGGGIHQQRDSFSQNATSQIANTILAGNTLSGTATLDDCRNAGVTGSGTGAPTIPPGRFTSVGYNLTVTGTNSGCSFNGPGDQIIPASQLAQVLNPTLANNGGATPTHALLPNSPAINAGNPAGCRNAAGVLLTTDQRGRLRLPPCDIGAYEADQLSIVLTKTVGVNPGVCAATTAIVVNQGTSVYYCALVRNTGNVTLTTHTLSDPALGLNVTASLPVAPGEVVSITNVLVAGLGPILANRTLSNTLTLTSTGAGLSNSQRASAQVIVPTIDVVKTVGASPADCVASSASWSTYAGAWRYYCVTVRNASPFTFTQFTLVDPLLNLNQPVALMLPPSGTVQIDNALLNTLLGQPTLLGPIKTIALPENTAVIPDTVNNVIVTATGGGQTVTGAPLRATNSAAATVIWSKPAITRTITTVGTDAVATRTITVTVYGQGNSAPSAQLPLRDRAVHLRVVSGNSRNNGPYPAQLTNAQGQVIFRYVSYGPETAVQAAAPQVCIPETVTLWVDLDGDGGPDGVEPQITDALCTAVELRSFSAQIDGEQVVIAWTTAVETANAGFNLYRSAALDGPYSQINPQLIGAQGDGAGATYRFVDLPPGAGPFYYQLEDVDYLGVRQRHPPTLARPAGATAGFTNQLYLPALWR